jgi:hypothetical protein
MSLLRRQFPAALAGTPAHAMTCTAITPELGTPADARARVPAAAAAPARDAGPAGHPHGVRPPRTREHKRRDQLDAFAEPFAVTGTLRKFAADAAARGLAPRARLVEAA